MFLIDAHHLGSQATGNETWIRNIIREWAQMDLPVVYAVTREGRAALQDLHPGAPIEILSDRATLRLAVELPRLIRQLRPAATLVQYTMPLSRTPCVVMVHDVASFEASAAAWIQMRATRVRYRWSTRTSARWARVVLAPSEFTKQRLVACLGVPEDRVVVAANAVDGALLPLLGEGGAPEPVEGRILVVGNVLPRKNIITVARAVEQLVAAGVACELRVVGSIAPSGRAEADQILKLLGAAVSFSGYVDQEQLAREYRSAQVLAFPSAYEGFGIPLLEAMAAGVPVAASDGTSLPEVAGAAAVLVETHDSEAWARALRGLLEDAGHRATLVERGHARARNYSWRTSAKAVADALYRAAGLSISRGT